MKPKKIEQRVNILMMFTCFFFVCCSHGSSLWTYCGCVYFDRCSKEGRPARRAVWITVPKALNLFDNKLLTFRRPQF